jgi:iron(III) transport system ATP-binding protein
MFGSLDTVLTRPDVSSAPSADEVVTALSPEPVVVDAVSVELGGIDVVRSASIEVAAGQVLALLGPSGCGKTTLLRTIAGLQRSRAGSITIGDHVVCSRSTFVAPEKRRVGMVFQDGGLFPHLTVAENIGFGLRHHPDPAARAADMLTLVGMEGYAARLPGTLSGGQQQRIAVARALAPEPSVLLLDEPFSALDAGLRVQIRREVKRLLADLGITTIVVTHDQEEAFAMGEQIAVMADGVIEQVGTPAELYESPASPWVAAFVGDGVRVEGSLSNGMITTPLGPLPVHGAGHLPLVDGPVVAIVRPEQLELRPGDTATVVDIEYYGHDVRYDVLLDDGTAATVRAQRADFAIDDRVSLAFAGGSVPTWPIA